MILNSNIMSNIPKEQTFSVISYKSNVNYLNEINSNTITVKLNSGSQSIKDFSEWYNSNVLKP
tara:strand:+ start:151 stop:339 length:189 start_codon:yes stop_codon:yes gene_type:complete